MRTLFISLTLLLTFSTVFGQKLKKVTSEHQSPPFKEKFYVLKSDETTRQGAYIKEVRKTVWVKGQYQNDIKVGVWEYYDMKGKLAHKLNVETGELLYNRFEDETKNFDKSKYSRPAILLGGTSTIYKNVMYLLRYPAEARIANTQGKVYVKFIVDELGKMGNSQVIEGIGDGCDEEAVRIMNLVDQEWLPALDLDGKPIKSEITLPITYRLL